MNKRRKIQGSVADNHAYRTVRTSYVICMHNAEFMIKLLVVFVFMLLRNRNVESERSKAFEACLSYIMAVGNIFKQTKIQMDSASVIF